MTTQKYMICNSGEADSTIFMDENEVQIFEELFSRLNDNSSISAPTITMCVANHVTETAKIWTNTYRPFVMGGSVNEGIYTIVPIIEKRTINDFDFFSFQTSKGSIRVAESQTGGIIADSFEELIKNIEGCSKEVLQAQIDKAKSLITDMTEKTNEEFFSLYKY